MLPLDDPLWRKLQHAYGDAADIPGKLARLTGRKTLSKDYWTDLWSALCHQYNVDSASYAALPHLVSATKTLSAKNRWEAMFLASGIVACSENGRRPKMPPKLSGSFKKALKSGRKVLAEMVNETRKTPEDSIYFLAMIAAFEGHSQLTGCLWRLSQGFVCPSCNHEFEKPTTELCDF